MLLGHACRPYGAILFIEPISQRFRAGLRIFRPYGTHGNTHIDPLRRNRVTLKPARAVVYHARRNTIPNERALWVLFYETFAGWRLDRLYFRRAAASVRRPSRATAHTRIRRTNGRAVEDR